MNPSRPIARSAAVLLAFAALLAGCGSSSSTSSSAAAKPASTPGPVASGNLKVAISNYAFAPATTTVKSGTKVTFTNHDQTAHTATSTKTAFDTGTVKPGASKTVTLTKPGTYTYYCQFHAFMRGTIVVK